MKTIEQGVLNKESLEIFSTAHEPIMIKNLGFFVSLEDIEQDTKDQIRKGIMRGIEDSKAGRTTEGGQALIDNLQTKLQERLSNKI